MSVNKHTLIDITGLQEAVANFAKERDWERFHSPKNLAMALTGEVGELIELFQWCTEEESLHLMHEPETAKKVKHEVADVMLYLVQIINALNIDINDAVKEKMQINAQKYPSDQTFFLPSMSSDKNDPLP